MPNKPHTPCLLLAAILIIFTAGCAPQTTRLNTITIDEPTDSQDYIDLEVIMAGGALKITHDGSDRVTGAIRTNKPEWQPSITKGANGFLLSQGDITQITQKPPAPVVNDWQINLSDTPTSLRVEANAFEGEFDLTGANLKDFTLIDYLSDSEISFHAPSPVVMDKFILGSSGSTMRLNQLGNANFRQMESFVVGGDYVLDFSGTLQRDTQVQITTGLGNIRVVIPRSTNTIVTVTGANSRFTVTGPWVVDNTVYTNHADGYLLNILIEMDFAFLTLVLE